MRLSDRELYEACCCTGSDAQASAYTELYWDFYRIALNMFTRTHHPDPEAIAADCAQEALIKVHLKISHVEAPDAFRTYGRKTLRNHVLNQINQWQGEQKHIASRTADEHDEEYGAVPIAPASDVSARIDRGELAIALAQAIQSARLSERSRMVIAGKYLLELDDQVLADQVTEAEQREILPSHIQITRSKNFRKLRENPVARGRLQPWLEELQLD